VVEGYHLRLDDRGELKVGGRVDRQQPPPHRLVQHPVQSLVDVADRAGRQPSRAAVQAATLEQPRVQVAQVQRLQLAQLQAAQDREDVVVQVAAVLDRGALVAGHADVGEPAGGEGGQRRPGRGQGDPLVAAGELLA
jgi:hypothetical protein